jgi:hypothetical protein
LRAAAPAAVTTANATLATGALQNAYEEQRKRNLIIGSVLGALALLFAVIMGLRAAGILGANANRPGEKMLRAQGSLPGQVLMAPGNRGARVMQATAEKPRDLRMPQDVYDWLKHLEKCEGIKNQIIGDQYTEMQVFQQKLSALGAGIGLMDPYEQSKENGGDEAPGSYTAGKVKDLRPRWQELIEFFHSKRPPAECQPIADDFDNGLNEIGGELGDITDLLNGADVDPQAMLQSAKKMQNKSYDIDRYLMKCDKGVGAICNKYNVNKWFNINPDPMAGGVTGKMGITAPATALAPGGG